MSYDSGSNYKYPKEIKSLKVPNDYKKIQESIDEKNAIKSNIGNRLSDEGMSLLHKIESYINGDITLKSLLDSFYGYEANIENKISELVRQKRNLERMVMESQEPAIRINNSKGS